MASPTPPSDTPPGRSPTFWAIVTVLIALNIWYDYYHPLGVMFDVLLGVFLLIRYLGKSKPT